MILAALQIAGGIWAAGSLIVLVLLMISRLQGQRGDLWMWPIVIILGPITLAFEAWSQWSEKDR